MDPKKEEILIIILAFALLILAYFTINPSIHGFLIFEQDLQSSLIYNESLVNITDSTIELRPLIETNQLTNTTIYNYEILKATYNPSDKLNKLDSLDNNFLEINKNSLLDLEFNSELNNGNIINLYLKGDTETDVYLCELSTNCDSPGYGLVHYSAIEELYSITLSNLQEPIKYFNLDPPIQIKIDYINSTQTTIKKTFYNADDKTNKVESLGNGQQTINKNNLFTVIFEDKLYNGYKINLYLKQTGKPTIIYLCNPLDFCELDNYGSIEYDGQEGYYSLTIQNLNSPQKQFNLNPLTQNIEIDYINATNTETTTYEEITITYPGQAAIETQDIQPENLSSWDFLNVNSTLNNQQITYQYSIDSGQTWTALTDFNLTDINSTKIRFKVTLISDTTSTPVINSLILTYNLIEEQNQTEPPSNETNQTQNNETEPPINQTEPPSNETNQTQEIPPEETQESVPSSSSSSSGGLSKYTKIEEIKATPPKEKEIKLFEPVKNYEVEEEQPQITSNAVAETPKQEIEWKLFIFPSLIVIIVFIYILKIKFKKKIKKKKIKKKKIKKKKIKKKKK